MAVATDVIISQYGVSNEDYRFSMLYTPMDTGEWSDNTVQGLFFNSIFPLFLIVWANMGSNIIALANEDHEEKILWILKRIGMRDSVYICQKAMLYFGSCVFFLVPMMILFKYIALTNVDLVIVILYSLVIAAQMFLIEIILKYLMSPGKAWIVKFFYYLSQFVLTILSAFQ